MNSAFLQSGNIYRAVRQPSANVRILKHDSLHRVVVTIDSEHFRLNAVSVITQFLSQRR